MLCFAKLLQLYLTLCDLMDCSPPGSSVHKILQVKILEWVAMPSSRGVSSTQGLHPCLLSTALASRFFTTSTTCKALLGHYKKNDRLGYSGHNFSVRSRVAQGIGFILYNFVLGPALFPPTPFFFL